jgi:hypothetical protein
MSPEKLNRLKYLQHRKSVKTLVESLAGLKETFAQELNQIAKPATLANDDSMKQPMLDQSMTWSIDEEVTLPMVISTLQSQGYITTIEVQLTETGRTTLTETNISPEDYTNLKKSEYINDHNKLTEKGADVLKNPANKTNYKKLFDKLTKIALKQIDTLSPEERSKLTLKGAINETLAELKTFASHIQANFVDTDTIKTVIKSISDQYNHCMSESFLTHCPPNKIESLVGSTGGIIKNQLNVAKALLTSTYAAQIPLINAKLAMSRANKLMTLDSTKHNIIRKEEKNQANTSIQRITQVLNKKSKKSQPLTYEETQILQGNYTTLSELNRQWLDDGVTVSADVQKPKDLKDLKDLNKQKTEFYTHYYKILATFEYCAAN